ncbi:signal peptide peptidase SppA [Prevotella jejuni]|uniref:signal peptide peptidase SppA n=1 Tax=Prevotella jejuni TaxID=1177574 RepID=UPI001BA48201|nr:signal peptide peptidase SppA [Prevotella jejuni]QUB80694.1 signal peptide peptidase SppA [Prevotella jejuni]
MKQFFKFVFASFFGMMLFSIVTGFFALCAIVGMITSQDATKEPEENSVLVLNLSGQLSERSDNNFLSQLQGTQVNSLGLDNLIEGVKKAKDNDNIKGIYIEAGAFTADSYASMQALRNALLDFKKSRKWIIAYADTYTQGTYYLSSVADKVYLNPQGQIDWHGLASEPVFIKDLLAKFGVKMQVVKVGAYKSATEMFTGDKMSDANREQTSAYLNSIWGNITKEVGASRGLSVAQLNAYADSMITFADPQEYVKLKLVDGLLYTDQIKTVVKKQLGIDSDDDIEQVTIADMVNTEAKNQGDENNKVAVYYAYGDIVDGAVGGLFSQGHQIDAQVVCKDLADLAKDKDVKAVVIRINSGGGSAYASEQIWHQIMEMKKLKPVVVSMGGMAASGGYYMSAPANWIVAEPTTITGSIGIFGMFPDVSNLFREKLGLKFDEVKTNKYADFGTRARPFTEEEMSYLSQYVNRGYKLFRHRVAEGRKMTDNQVEKIAQGHVFTGQDAQKIGLVDQLGGLDVAVAKAAQLAKLPNYRTSAYPEADDVLDQILKQVKPDTYLSDELRANLGDYYEPFTLLKTINQQSAIQARLPFYPNIH